MEIADRRLVQRGRIHGKNHGKNAELTQAAESVRRHSTSRLSSSSTGYLRFCVGGCSHGAEQRCVVVQCNHSREVTPCHPRWRRRATADAAPGSSLVLAHRGKLTPVRGSEPRSGSGDACVERALHMQVCNDVYMCTQFLRTVQLVVLTRSHHSAFS